MRRVSCTKVTRRWQDFMPSPTRPFFLIPMPSSAARLLAARCTRCSRASRQTAAVAVRILGGEKAGDIKIPPIGFATPKFDWREMQRWGISESRLPPGSEIQFREPTAWEQYWWLILARRCGASIPGRADRLAAL